MNNLDYSKKSNIPKIYLCNHNKSKIGILKNVTNFTLVEKFAQINEVSFEMPYYIDKHHIKTKNPHIDEIKFLYTLLIDGEYYTIEPPKRSGNGYKETKQIQAYLLPYELRHKLIFNYEDTKNAQDILTDVLANTGWSVGYVYSGFISKTRTFSESSTNVLDMIFKIEETFNGILQFNTSNQTISLYDITEFNSNKGFVIKYGKYLKTIEEYYEDGNICTRLYPTGSDGLTIASISPTGESVIEDLTYFKSYMSTSLLNAQNNYETLLSNYDGTMSGYITSLDTYNSELVTLQNQLSILQIGDDSFAAYTNDTDEAKFKGKYAIDDYLAILNPIAEKTAEQQNDLTHYNTLKGIIDGLISTKSSEITSKQSQITTKESQISSLQNTLSLSNNFTPTQLTERQKFIIESEYPDDNITDATTLLDEAKKKLAQYAQPVVEYKIDSVDLLQAIECQRDWDKVVIGDIITIQYPEPLNIDVQVKITEISHGYSDRKLTFTIANTKNRQLFEKLYKNASYASSTLSRNKNRFADTLNNKSYIEALVENRLQDVVSGFKMSTNNSVEQSGQGIIIRNVDNTNNYLHLNNSALAIVKDGTYKTAVSGDGVIAEQLIGKQIVGVNAEFEGMQVLNTDGSTLVEIGEFLDNGQTIRGLKVNSGALIIDGGLTDDNINSQDIATALSTAQQALSNAATAQSTADGKIDTYYQNDAPTGVSIGDLWIDTNDGNKLYRYTGSIWVAIQDAAIQTALSNAATAQSTADGKITSFYQNIAPTTGMSVGDFWIDTDDKNKLYRYSGSVWEAARDTDIATAIANAATAQSDATNALGLLSDIASDGKLTPDEKIKVKKEWDIIVSEKTAIDTQADAYSVSKTNYGAAYTTLSDYIAPLLANMSTTSNITRTTFNTNFQNYYDQKIAIINAITNALKSTSVQVATAYNKVKISTDNGIQVFDANNVERLKMGDLGSSVYGWYAKNSSGTIKTQINSDGTLTANDGVFTGNITMTGGSISWSNVTKPTYNASEVGALPTDTFIPDDTYITTITESTVTAAYINALNITSGRTTVKSGNTTLLDSYNDTNGGKLAIYDNAGNINVRMGVEGVGGAGAGGTLVLYNDSIDKQRVELGISASNDCGIINLRDTNGKARIVFDARSSNPFISIMDGEESAKTYLYQTSGYINGYKIRTEETPLVAVFG